MEECQWLAKYQPIRDHQISTNHRLSCSQSETFIRLSTNQRAVGTFLLNLISHSISLFWDSAAAGHISDLSSDMILVSNIHWDAWRTLEVRSCMLSDFDVAIPILDSCTSLVAFTHSRGCLVAMSLFWDSAATGHMSDLSFRYETAQHHPLGCLKNLSGSELYDVARPFLDRCTSLIAFTHSRGCLVAMSFFWDSPTAGHTRLGSCDRLGLFHLIRQIFFVAVQKRSCHIKIWEHTTPNH